MFWKPCHVHYQIEKKWCQGSSGSVAFWFLPLSKPLDSQVPGSSYIVQCLREVCVNLSWIQC